MLILFLLENGKRTLLKTIKVYICIESDMNEPEKYSPNPDWNIITKAWISTVDPWTTWVWTAQVHLYAEFFNKYIGKLEICNYLKKCEVYVNQLFMLLVKLLVNTGSCFEGIRSYVGGV